MTWPPQSRPNLRLRSAEKRRGAAGPAAARHILPRGQARRLAPGGDLRSALRPCCAWTPAVTIGPDARLNGARPRLWSKAVAVVTLDGAPGLAAHRFCASGTI